jgi:ABC-type lipoprotein export system ATPase subunit
LIKLKSVAKVYQNKLNNKMAFKDINLVFPNRGLILLTGESGSGKTSLLNCISGLDKFSDGEMFCSKALSFSFVFQDYQLIEDLTVIENLRFLIDLKYISSDNEIDEVLRKFGIYDVRNHMPSELSGGQKQRLSIVRAILQHSNVILADEPSGNLDSENSKNVSALLKEISKERLVIVASHEPSLFLEISDGYIQIEKGEIVKTSLSTQTDLTLDKPCQNSYRKLPLKSAFRIAFKGFRKTLPRMLITILLLVISLSMLLIFTTIAFNDEVSSSYAIFQEEGIQSIDYLKNANNSFSSGVVYKSMTIEEYSLLFDNYGTEKVSKFHLTSNFYLETGLQSGTNQKITVSRIYESSSCNFNILFGTNDLTENQILVSEFVANQIIENSFLSSISEILNNIIFLNGIPFEIAGIYESTLYSDVDNIENTISYYSSVWLSESNYYLISTTGENGTVYFYDNDNSLTTIKIQKSNLVNENLILLGRTPSDISEVMISSYYAKELYGEDYNINTVIGEVVWFNFTSFLSGTSDEVDMSDFNNFTIVGIYDEELSYKPSLYFESTTYSDLYFNYAIQSMENSSIIGLTFFDFDQEILKDLSSLNMLHYSPISEEIYSFSDIINKLRIILVCVCVCFTLLSMLVFLGHVKNEIYVKKNEYGVLLYLNLNEKQLTKILFWQSGALTIATLLFSLIVYNLCISSLNSYLIDNDIVSFDIIGPSTKVIIIIGVLTLIFAISIVSISIRKFKKLNIIDLILGK